MHFAKPAFALGAVIAAGFALPASAQDAKDQDYLGSLKECQTLTDNTARLACYDGAVSAMVTATNDGDLQIVGREEVKKTRRRLFGFSLPDIGIFGKGDGKDDELDELESVVTSVRRVNGDTFIFEIEEGGQWQITNAPMRLIAPKTGDKVVFKKAAMGTYFVRFNNQIGVKGRRIR